jgi:hypothetical protein
MARLPQPGGDKGTWGTVLNEFLGEAHNTDGSLKAVAQSKVTGLTTDLAAKANIASLAPVATSGLYTDLSAKPTIPTTATDIGAEPAGLSSATQTTLSGTYALASDLSAEIVNSKAAAAAFSLVFGG